MMKTYTLIALILVLLPSAVAAAPDYREADLANGMKVVTREDRSVGLVAVVMMVRAGSANETDRTNGMSHLLEHLVFDGTKTRSREEIRQAFDRMGGYVNAYTRRDHVGHEIVMPTEFISKGIELQADMLLNSTIPDAELAKEKKVVIEEIRQAKGNPQSVVSDIFDDKIFGGTPYARPVMGTEESVQAATHGQVLEFYHEHYHPANMTAFVVGDIKHEDVLRMIESAYKGAAAAKPTITPTVKQKLRSDYLVIGAAVPGTHLEIALPAPPVQDQNAGYYELIAGILGGGDDSRLYRRLVQAKRPLARYVSAAYEVHPGGAMLHISVMPAAPSDAGAILGTIVDEIGRITSGDVTQAEIERAKTGYKTGEVFGSERALHLARELAAWEALGSYQLKHRLLDQVTKTDLQSLQAAAKAYLAKPEMLAALIGPEAKVQGVKLEAAEPAPEVPASVIVNVDASSDSKPAEGQITLKKVLPNGLTIIVRENPYADIVSTNVLIKDRSAIEPADLPGIGNIDSMMLDEGTTNRTADQIQSIFAATGARLQLVDNLFFGFDDYYLSKNYSYIRLESLSEHFDADIGVLADMIIHPAYPQDRLEAIRNEVLSRFTESESSPYFKARKAFFTSLFPDHHYRTPISGTPESVNKTMRKDLIAYHSKAYAPNNLIITVVGNRPAQTMIDTVAKAFGDIKPTKLQKPQSVKVVQHEKPVVLTNNVQSEQAAIYIGNALPAMDLRKLPAVELVTEILNTRLNSQVREKMGLAYSIGAETELSPFGGWFYVSTGTGHENVDKAKDAIASELTRLRNEPVSQDELTLAVSSIWGRRFRYRQARINQAYFLGHAEYLGLGYKFDDEFISRLRKLTSEDVQRTAREIISMPGYTVSVAGVTAVTSNQ